MNQKITNSRVNTEIDEKESGFLIYRKVGECNCGLVCWKIMKEKFRQLAFENCELQKSQHKKCDEEKNFIDNSDVLELDDDGNVINFHDTTVSNTVIA